MTHSPSRWDRHAVRLIRDQGWRNMPEAAAIAILTAARIPIPNLYLTFTEMLEQAGHYRVRHHPCRHSDMAKCNITNHAA